MWDFLCNNMTSLLQIHNKHNRRKETNVYRTLPQIIYRPADWDRGSRFCEFDFNHDMQYIYMILLKNNSVLCV